MLEKENATGFTVLSKIQQGWFEIARLIPVNFAFKSSRMGNGETQLNVVQLYYNRHLPCCLTLCC
jgi:hypothetical protein